MSRYEPRIYRKRVAAEGLLGFHVIVRESDLHVQAAPPAGAQARWEDDIRQVAREAARAARRAIEVEIALWREFATSMKPLPDRPGAPDIVRAMYAAGQRAGVGPMAAVAGAVAEFTARELLALSEEVIVENGGDIFLSIKQPRTVAVFAGRSPLSGKLGIAIPAPAALGVCTSSGTVGHSHSEGRADAAVVIADDCACADAMATALGNRVREPEDLAGAVEWAMKAEGVRQALAIMGDALAVAGEFEVTAGIG